MAATSRSALVLYGTETGNSQDIAYELDQSLSRLHFATLTRELDAIQLADLVRYNLVVFAISTTGQGDFPTNARKFWLSLLRKKLTATSLSRLRYAMVGLCDSSYPKFNLAARKLHKRLKQLGATPILETCEADEQGEEGTEGAFLAWLPQFEARTLSSFPLAQGQEPIPKNQRLPSTWILARADTTERHLELEPNGEHVTLGKPTKGSSFVVTLEENRRVTPAGHWQDVRLLKLRSERPIEYSPGDALAIRPQNHPNEVEELIVRQGWQDVADVPIQLRNHSSPLTSIAVFDSTPSAQSFFTLRELLVKHLDISAIPRRSFFSKIAHLTEDATQKERALEFTNPQYLDEYFDYATRPRRSILEVLQEFHTVKIPWQEAANVFPLMRPRQFSIASGGCLKQDGYMFELLVAIVKYRTVIKRIREGVCTKYLAKLPTGTRLDVVLHTEGRFHAQVSDLDRQHLLIGGGTGIAPLRSTIYEKGTFYPRAVSTLVFGCRNAHSDYFFGQEWTEMESCQDPSLRVVTAFSRDQKSKVYVQDRLREHADLVRQILKDTKSLVIVCGSAGAMPKAVRQAIKDILTDEISSEAAAEELLVRFEKEGRYKQETW